MKKKHDKIFKYIYIIDGHNISTTSSLEMKEKCPQDVHHKQYNLFTDQSIIKIYSIVQYTFQSYMKKIFNHLEDSLADAQHQIRLIFLPI